VIEIDVSGLDRWMRFAEEAPAQCAKALQMAVNDAGNLARTQVVRTLAIQMGLPFGTVRQGLQTKTARGGDLTYELNSSGGYLSLKSFDARQVRAGVSARPWGQRRVFRSAFVIPRFGGEVFVRTSRARFPIKKLWGPSMPQEMIRGAVPKAFEDTIRARLPQRLRHHLDRYLKQ
jgi:hypothetical protein